MLVNKKWGYIILQNQKSRLSTDQINFKNTAKIYFTNQVEKSKPNFVKMTCPYQSYPLAHALIT